MIAKRGPVISTGGVLQGQGDDGYDAVTVLFDRKRKLAREEGLLFRAGRRKVHFDQEILTFGCWSMRRKVK